MHQSLRGRSRLYNLVNCLGESCPWTKQMKAKDMLFFLESEVHELREEISALDTLRSKEAIISELGDILFDALMLEMILRKEYDFGVNDAWDTVATKVERRTPYMREWGDGITSAETVEEAEAIWQNVKKKEKQDKQKQSELEKLGARQKSSEPVEKEENFIEIETQERRTKTSSVYRKLQSFTIFIGTALSKASKMQMSNVCTGVIVGYFIGYRLGK